MKDETGGVSIEEVVGLKPKMYSFFVDNNEHKKIKGVSRNIVTTISHIEYKDVILNKKCIRLARNRIQSKDHRIITFKSTKFHCLVLMRKYMSKAIDTTD